MEVSRGDAPRNEHVQIEVDQEHVFVLFNEERQQLEEGAVRRSKLLTDLLDSQPGQATLPVDAASLHNWRKHVQLQLTDESYEGLSNVEAKEEMVRLMKVSEFLLDTETGHRTARALADALLVKAEAGSVENKVLKELHPDLQLKVVKAAGCRLAHLQSRLVSELQPLALESFVKDGDKLDLSDEMVSRDSPGPPVGLESMAYLKTLSLARSDGASGDPQRLSEALSKLVNLTHLNLHSNMLQSAACAPLATALKCMPSLAHLDLSSNVLQLQGLETLAPAISDLKEITHLSLAENSIVAGTTSLRTILASLPKLNVLALDHNAILRPTASTTDESAAESAEEQQGIFSPMSALASLMLSNNCLDNADVDRLVRPLIDACVSTLTALDLSDNSLSTKAVPAMCKIVATCTALRSLDISSCAFSCNQIAEIVSAIPDQTQPTETTGNEPSQHVQPAPLLESLALREMDPFPMEPDEDVDALPTALQRFSHLKTFDISSLELPAHAMEALPIGSFTALTTLDVSMNCVLQQSPLGTQLSSLTALQCLNVNSLFLPDDVLLSFAAALSSLTALSVLDMGNNAITSGPACSALAKALAVLPSLQSLDLSDNDVLDTDSAFVAALPRMTNLRELSLQQNELHDDTFAPLACALAQLSLLNHLSIAAICAVGSSAGTPPALRLFSTLTSLTNLTSLCISSNSFQGPDASALAEILLPLSKLSHLEMAMVELPPTHLGSAAKALAQMSSLTSLDMSNNSMRLEGAEALAPHLAQMTWLRDLDLSSAMLSPAGLSLIGDSLRQLTALRAVRLDDVVGSGSAPEAWGRVFAALADIAGLRELELRYNRFPSSCIAKHIAPHMSGLTALESLDLQDCSMSREGVKQMMLAMQPLTRLHSLNLGGNRIKDNVDKIVANHPLLEELDLPRAHLKDAEANLLLTSLKPMQMLRLVTLTDNLISDSVQTSVTDDLPHVLVVFDDMQEMEEIVSIDGDELEDGEEDGEESGDADVEDGESGTDEETDSEVDSGSYSDSDTEEYISEEDET